MSKKKKQPENLNIGITINDYFDLLELNVNDSKEKEPDADYIQVALSKKNTSEYFDWMLFQAEACLRGFTIDPDSEHPDMFYLTKRIKEF